MSTATIDIDVRALYEETARLPDLPDYVRQVVTLAGEGNDIVLTGQGPIWLYLRLAHALHGKARSLTYRSPVTGDVVIFNHNPY